MSSSDSKPRFSPLGSSLTDVRSGEEAAVDGLDGEGLSNAENAVGRSGDEERVGEDS